MNKKIWKALGIAVCMLALAAPRAMAKTYEVGTEDKFAEAVQEINNKSSDVENEIVLMQKITLGGDPTYTLKRGRTTIKGEGHKITIESNAGIKVTGEETILNLGAEKYDGVLTIDGNTRAAFITVSDGATANMYGNVTLQNRKPTGNACVAIMGSKSVFNMRGGVIEKCSRAVSADSGATFHMFDGEIKDCRVGGNGVILVNGGSGFIMDGGTISGCKANAGGGLYADHSTITIKGGTISGCKVRMGAGGGLCATNQSTITIKKGGTISGCSAGAGGGLYADNSIVTINKGTISGCKAVNGYGGGLYAKNYSTVTIEDGTISECCTTSDIGMGGGLYAYHSTITIGGGTIEKNRAVYGGGVALNNSWINPITNWTVIGNEAYKAKSGNGGIGGGIYLDSVSMNVSAGSNRIYNNQAEGHGADICLEKGASIKLPIAANMGATFGDSGINIDGWYNDKPPYKPSKDVNPVDVSETLTGKQSLVASYKADPVRIEIDANGGEGGSSSQTVHKGTNVILEAPAKEGYLFKGWKDEKGNSYPAEADGKVKITVNKDMKLKAVWEVKSFTVTYVLLDGKTRTETAAYGENVTLVEEPRTGYTFVGWKDGEKMRQAGETITVTGNVTLTAVWEARTFTVTYVLLDGKTRTETQ